METLASTRSSTDRTQVNRLEERARPIYVLIGLGINKVSDWTTIMDTIYTAI